MNGMTYSPCPSCSKLNRVPVGSAQEGKHQPVCGSCRTPLPMHGDVSEVTASGLMTLVEKSPLPVIADFWAPWCGPCKAFAPTFETAARQLGGEFAFAKINTEDNPLAASHYGIRGIPTLILFSGGREVGRQSGALPLQAFMGWLRSAHPQRSTA